MNIKLAAWLDAQETKYRFVLYEADPSVSSWTRRCLRQADLILLVGQAASDPTPSEIEVQLVGLVGDQTTARRVLVLLHPDGSRQPVGTRRWLATRQVEMHHHLLRVPGIAYRQAGGPNAG
jgi:hypothetical protein